MTDTTPTEPEQPEQPAELEDDDESESEGGDSDPVGRHFPRRADTFSGSHPDEPEVPEQDRPA